MFHQVFDFRNHNVSESPHTRKFNSCGKKSPGLGTKRAYKEKGVGARMEERKAISCCRLTIKPELLTA